MNTMLFLKTRVIDGRVCAIDPNSMRWVPACASFLAMHGCLFRMH